MLQGAHLRQLGNCLILRPLQLLHLCSQRGALLCCICLCLLQLLDPSIQKSASHRYCCLPHVELLYGISPGLLKLLHLSLQRGALVSCSRLCLLQLLHLLLQRSALPRCLCLCCLELLQGFIP